MAAGPVRLVTLRVETYPTFDEIRLEDTVEKEALFVTNVEKYPTLEDIVRDER